MVSACIYAEGEGRRGRRMNNASERDVTKAYYLLANLAHRQAPPTASGL